MPSTKFISIYFDSLKKSPSIIIYCCSSIISFFAFVIFILLMLFLIFPIYMFINQNYISNNYNSTSANTTVTIGQISICGGKASYPCVFVNVNAVYNVNNTNYNSSCFSSFVNINSLSDYHVFNNSFNSTIYFDKNKYFNCVINKDIDLTIFIFWIIFTSIIVCFALVVLFVALLSQFFSLMICVHQIKIFVEFFYSLKKL